MSINWKKAARVFRRRAINIDANWSEMLAENTAARECLRKLLGMWQIQRERRSGAAHLTAEAMEALLEEGFNHATRVLGGERLTTRPGLASELNRIVDTSMEKSGYPDGSCATISFAFGAAMAELVLLAKKLS